MSPKDAEFVNMDDLDSLRGTPSRTSFEEDSAANLPLLVTSGEGQSGLDHRDRLDFPEEWRNGKATSRRFGQSAEMVSQSEADLTVRDAIRAYPMAIFWSLAVSTVVIMEGFDMSLLGNFFAFPTFQKKYGEFVGVTEETKSGYQLSPGWMAIIGQASGFGAFFGTLLNGHLVSAFGHKRVLIGALVALSCFIFLTFFAPNIKVLLVGQILCGFPWGVFATTSVAYASEVLPTVLRIYLTTYTNVCFIIGQIFSSAVLRACLTRDDEWGFRIPFACQWIWPSFLIPLLCFAPESPWHLVRKNRFAEAEKSLRRLQRASARIDVKDTLAMIIHTDNLESDLSVGTSYWDCFKGFELRRTEIACVSFAGQIFTGLSFAFSASYFFEKVGLAPETTYTLNFGGMVIAFVGTLVNWLCLVPYRGRRTIYLFGTFVMAMILYLIGVLNIWTDIKFVAMTQALLTLVWTFVFQASVGQLGWSFPAEIGSTRLRQKTICVARNTYYIAAVTAGALNPYFLNPRAWNLRGYTGFIWGTTALITFIWAYFRLPETRDRTYEQLDILFAKRVPARQFAVTDVHAFDAQMMNQLEMRYSFGSLDEGREELVSTGSRQTAARTNDNAVYERQRDSVDLGGSDVS